uniref:Uncharacterized protein n=1 Tax=Caenorhabditis japonica TaxID=281687 RepID=A0A8R1I582_CAEJA
MLHFRNQRVLHNNSTPREAPEADAPEAGDAEQAVPRMRGTHRVHVQGHKVRDRGLIGNSATVPVDNGTETDDTQDQPERCERKQWTRNGLSRTRSVPTTVFPFSLILSLSIHSFSGNSTLWVTHVIENKLNE